MYVGRWNNGAGYMEWAGQPVDSIDEAKAQVQQNTGWTNVDVIEVWPGNGLEDSEGATVATRQQGRGWSDE